MHPLTTALVFVLTLTVSVHASQDEEILHRMKRVINGRSLNKTEFPFLVSIRGSFFRTLFGFIPVPMIEQCGASLLNNQWLLSAAHCFPRRLNNRIINLNDPSKWTATLATKRISPSWRDYVKHLFGRVMRRKKWYMWKVDIEKIIIHPRFIHQDSNGNGQLHYDIALLKMEKPVPHQQYDTMAPIRLPTAAMSLGRNKWPPSGTKCLFAGWGCKQNGGRSSKFASKINFTIIPDSRCLGTFGSRYVNLENDMCAGHYNGNKGICSGDSGGPLICEKDGIEYQAGIASATAAAQPESFPGIFTRVSSFRSWIINTMNNN